jgi:hypothetical protein
MVPAKVKTWGIRMGAGATALVLAGAASAADDISTLFDSIDLSSISTKIMAVAVTIVGIALVIKGPAIVKRLIAKI